MVFEIAHQVEGTACFRALRTSSDDAHPPEKTRMALCRTSSSVSFPTPIRASRR